MGKRRRREEKRKLLRLSIGKVNRLIRRSEAERGQESEEFVLGFSEVLKKEGKIVDFCPTSSIKKLDRRRIDVIYWLEHGIYLVNVKSSKAGAIEHQFKQSLKQDLLIYPLIRHPGESTEFVKDKLSRIFQEPPSFSHLPDWIADELDIKKTERVFVLTDANARKIFENISGVSRVRAVPPQKTSLTEGHIEVVCWTKRGIYLFDIHGDKIIEGEGLKIFPLNLSWPKSRIEELLKEEPQKSFPAVVYGAIMDLE